jgi:hypothetical protein
VTEKADWEKAWERRYQLAAAMRRGEIQCNDDNAIRIAGERASFEAGYLAATKQAPAVPGVVTREHRKAALVSVGIKEPSSKATIAWLEEGTGAPVCAFAFEVAQAIADAESRGASRVEELTAEVERLRSAIKLLLQYKALGRPMPLDWLDREFGDSVRDASPPTDEVAGLLEDLNDMHILALDGAITENRRKSVAVRADRIEAFIKKAGQR